jgi:hypothetical protein
MRNAMRICARVVPLDAGETIGAAQPPGASTPEHAPMQCLVAGVGRQVLQGPVNLAEVTGPAAPRFASSLLCHVYLDQLLEPPRCWTHPWRPGC